MNKKSILTLAVIAVTLTTATIFASFAISNKDNAKTAITNEDSPPVLATPIPTSSEPTVIPTATSISATSEPTAIPSASPEPATPEPTVIASASPVPTPDAAKIKPVETSKYKIALEQAKANIAKEPNDPDGNRPRLADIHYPANKNKPLDSFKKLEEIKGFVSDEKLQKDGGKYILKKLMTYEEAYNSGIEKDLDPTIDPDRMIWVFRIKFDKTHNVFGSPVEKAIVTSMYDAETGDQLSVAASSDDPHGMDKIRAARILRLQR